MKHKTQLSKLVTSSMRVAILLIVGSILAYVLRIVFANNLSAHDYGLFYATLTFMMFLLIFRDFGFKQATIRYIATYRARENYSKIKSTILASFLVQSFSSLLLICFFIIGSSYLANSYFGDISATTLLLIFTVYILFSMLGGLLNSILIGFEQTKLYSLEESIRLGATLISFLLLLPQNFGVFAPAIAFVTGVIISFIFLLFATSKYRFIFKEQTSSIKESLKELFAFATPVIFTGLGNKVIAHIDTLMLTYFAALSVVGVYNVILPSALVFLFIGKAIATVLFPLSSKLYEKKDLKSLSFIITSLYTYLPIVIFAIITVGIVHARTIISLLFSDQYLAGTFAFQILLAGVGLYILTINNNTLLSAIGKPLYVTKIVGVAAIFNIALNALLIPLFGLVGAAVTTSLSYLLMLLASTYYLTKHVRFGIPYKKLLSLQFIALASVFCMHYSLTMLPGGIIGAILSSTLGMILYLCGLLILKLVTISELKQLYFLYKER